jgi:SAM-dependent methyltransferase
VGRATTLEFLDDRDLSHKEIDATLSFLRWVNGPARGGEASVDAIAELFGGEGAAPLRVLDVGTGAADIPRAIVERARAARQRIHVVAVDNHPRIVQTARAGVADMAEIDVMQLDADQLEAQFGPASFDIAHAALTLHHFKDDAALRLLTSMGRLARRRVVINDLIRDRTGMFVAWFMGLRTTRVVRHDAVLSVRRSFTMPEVTALARAAGLRDIEVRRRRGGRFLLSAVRATGAGQ